ncbi:DUF924 family protein [Chelativorans sp. ZYF759]|uniref:DUF924 family protein n=1 Tax=Chelativorans sp. ZYF759 TaxID=2692213 RepID=UPI00145EEB61|nr:DUF924 family protein [Chelativorans sp. ZYF759]NMG41004.1 DUF924 family protein [Chelativorans sp. ZYF759]
MPQENWVDEVLAFWFEELGPADWYAGGEELDTRIRSRFTDLHQRLKTELSVDEIDDARTAQAAIIVFDQFPRNIYRGTAEAFSTDDMAVQIARRALDAQFDRDLSDDEKSFIYMPFMHSEILADQERCVDLFRALSNEEGLKYAIDHRDVVAKYGRFPHRNKPLGRESTPAELEFLESHPGYGQ